MFTTITQNEHERFVEIWMEARRINQGITWVAKALGMSESSVSRHARILRKAGVRLPKLTPGAVKPDVTKLNDLIKRGKK